LSQIVIPVQIQLIEIDSMLPMDIPNNHKIRYDHIPFHRLCTNYPYIRFDTPVVVMYHPVHMHYSNIE
jgi:hypothetical protein